MKRIFLVAGQKGGCSKTTTAYGLAYYLAGQNRRTVFIDTDRPQFSGVVFETLRKTEPPFDVARCMSMRDVPKHAEDYEAIVFDGAPHASADTLAMARLADLIIIPTKVAIIDLKPQIELADELVEQGIKSKTIVFLIAQAGTEAEVRAARATIEKRQYRVIREDLRNSPAYSGAGDQGLSVLEVRYPTLKARAERVFAEIAAI